MSAVTALLIGGPRDGDLVTLRSSQDVLAVAVPAPVARYAAFVERSVSDVLEVRTRYYGRESVNLFGMRLDVWVYDGTFSRERDELVAKHLLSPVALGLLGGRRG